MNVFYYLCSTKLALQRKKQTLSKFVFNTFADTNPVLEQEINSLTLWQALNYIMNTLTSSRKAKQEFCNSFGKTSKKLGKFAKFSKNFRFLFFQKMLKCFAYLTHFGQSCWETRLETYKNYQIYLSSWQKTK